MEEHGSGSVDRAPSINNGISFRVRRAYCCNATPYRSRRCASSVGMFVNTQHHGRDYLGYPGRPKSGTALRRNAGRPSNSGACSSGTGPAREIGSCFGGSFSTLGVDTPRASSSRTPNNGTPMAAAMPTGAATGDCEQQVEHSILPAIVNIPADRLRVLEGRTR
jgi:hypothetical protein